ncbi:polysaccharide pyruvyl transferase family protein [Nocardioides sp. B-3]|uniref:polysaccharide pyruvyl transferase family protein n=1 Tax=Nocardioides sp. B-3 TaxID=2895565 RepID=UPI0021533C39|nr:polysaccharide pyruvyl transferase family protein [Nocardioides sp. B-3]UUZ57647.1 polysaccharide pyruvyl transferase family protein [Nocardioides sp. B-3]
MSDGLDVRQIAQNIAGADLFIGSSLHGAITAMAYAVPHVALDRISKLTAYLQTWGDGLTPFDVSASELIAASEIALRSSESKLRSRAEMMTDLSWRNTQRVLNAVER